MSLTSLFRAVELRSQTLSLTSGIPDSRHSVADDHGEPGWCMRSVDRAWWDLLSILVVVFISPLKKQTQQYFTLKIKRSTRSLSSKKKRTHDLKLNESKNMVLTHYKIRQKSSQRNVTSNLRKWIYNDMKFGNMFNLRTLLNYNGFYLLYFLLKVSKSHLFIT